MEKLSFKTPEELRAFYQSQGFFAIYYCTTEGSSVEVEHFGLLKSGDMVTNDCFGSNIMSLQDERVLEILGKFLHTGQIVVHPRIFEI